MFVRIIMHYNDVGAGTFEVPVCIVLLVISLIFVAGVFLTFFC